MGGPGGEKVGVDRAEDNTKVCMYSVLQPFFVYLRVNQNRGSRFVDHPCCATVQSRAACMTYVAILFCVTHFILLNRGPPDLLHT